MQRFSLDSRSCAKFQVSTINAIFLLSPNFLVIIKRKDGYRNALLQIIGKKNIEKFLKNIRKMNFCMQVSLLEKTLT